MAAILKAWLTSEYPLNFVILNLKSLQKVEIKKQFFLVSAFQRFCGARGGNVMGSVCAGSQNHNQITRHLGKQASDMHCLK